ncbi:Cathepsin K [Triplophysa tibetana]|uniref:Cathepsin K n=1 Tax=Triplophysa tibetana TaxID=1572043 RepID=A0A5A9N4B5_9TELE|nr:Cathepsin K [Triplophysa tibetana]
MHKFGGRPLLVAMMLCDVVHTLSKVPMNEAWENWKITYKREYNGLDEESIRQAIWEKNVLFIEAHNKEYEQGIHSYDLGMNQFGDMTQEELAEKLLRPEIPEISPDPTNTYMPDDTKDNFPASIDYRALGYVTSVKNQGSCGSCWAFSSVGALEGQLKRTTGKLVDLSPQNLMDCDGNSHGCDGGQKGLAFNYVRDNHGIDSEASYPYVGKVQKCAYKVSRKAANCEGYLRIPSGDERLLAAAVATVGPVSVSIDANHATFKHYKSGVYYNPNCTNVTSHAVLVVGYGATRKGERYWIVKNSWGLKFGTRGYVLMARDRNSACGIAKKAMFPLM